MECYKLAAEKDFPDAHYALGRLYETGKGGKQDDRLTYVWYKEGAYLGCTPCLSALDRCYTEGIGVERNLSVALDY